MSMTREEARIEIQSLKDTFEELEPGGTRTQFALKIALSALRPVSREQVEKVWRGKWIDAHPGTSSCKCTKCGAVQEYESTFCCHCGAPMTDEAVEMVVKRMEVLNDAD